LTFDGESISDAQITLGCLAPTIVHASAAETYLKGKQLTPEVCQQAGQLANEDVRPIDDMRGTATDRRATLASLVAHGLQRIAEGTHSEGWMIAPVFLDTYEASPLPQSFDGTISTTINGKPYLLAGAA